MKKENCIFCKIIAGECPSYKVFENEHAYAFLDISKDCYGHTLVIPKNHCTNVLDADPKDLAEVIKVVQQVSSHYTTKCGFKGVNIVNASGKEAQQSVFHLHFHILPRTDKNEFNAFPALGGTDVDFDEQIKKLKME